MTSPAASGAPAAAERPSFNLNVAVEKFSGGSKENPETFLRTIESAKSLYSWEDKQALAYAGLSLKGKALDWFNNQTEIITWAGFRRALIDRFGLDPSKMLSKLTKRTQEEKESVRDYADALRTLVRYSRDPHLKATLQHFFTEGLRADVATFVKSQRPKSFEEAVELGEYYEENFPAGTAVIGVRLASKGSAAATADPPAPVARGVRRAFQDSNANDPVGALTRQLEKLTIKLAQFEGRLGGATGSRPLPANRRPGAPGPCFHCGEDGHVARDCPNRNQAINLIDYTGSAYTSESEEEEEAEASDSEIETAYCDEIYAQSHEEIYANKRGLEEDGSAPAQVARRFKPTPFDPNALPDPAPACAPPRAGRAPLASQPAPAQRPAATPRPRDAPPAATAGPAARAAATARVANAAQRVSAANRSPLERRPPPAGRSGGNPVSSPGLSYDLVEQLTYTPAKLSIAALLRGSPAYRQQVREFVRRLEKEDTSGKPEPARVQLQAPAGAGKGTAGPSDRQAAAVLGQPQAYAAATASKACLHTEAGEESTSVVRTRASVLGLPVTAVIDSGASHSCISQIVARKLRLMHLLERTETSFLTAGGAREKPWGILRDVPIQVGKLKLTLDPVLVTAATNYSLLLGNDFMSQAAANLSWSDKKLSIMLTPDEYDEVDVEYMSRRKAGASRLNLLERADDASEQASLGSTGSLSSLLSGEETEPATEGPGQGIDEGSDQPPADCEPTRTAAVWPKADEGSWHGGTASESTPPSCGSDCSSCASYLRQLGLEQEPKEDPSPTCLPAPADSPTGSPPPNGTLITVATAYDILPPPPTLSNKFTYRPLREIEVEFESHFIPDSEAPTPAKHGGKAGEGNASDWEELSQAATESENTLPSAARLAPAGGEGEHSGTPTDGSTPTSPLSDSPGPCLFLTCRTDLDDDSTDGWSSRSKQDAWDLWDSEEEGMAGPMSLETPHALGHTRRHFRLGSMPPNPGEKGPTVLMTHHDAISDPWAHSEWHTVLPQPPQPPSPMSSVADEWAGDDALMGGFTVEEWTRSCERLDGWFVPCWAGWQDHKQAPPPRQPRWGFLWASDDPTITNAVFDQAGLADGPYPGQLVTVGSRTYLFLRDSQPELTEMEMCHARNPAVAECWCRACGVVGAYGKARGWPGYHRGPYASHNPPHPDILEAALLGAAAELAARWPSMARLHLTSKLVPIVPKDEEEVAYTDFTPAEWQKARELLSQPWYVASWKGWTDTRAPPPPQAGRVRVPRFRVLTARDDPRATAAVFAAAQQNDGPFPGQLITHGPRTYLFLPDSDPLETAQEVCWNRSHGGCNCRTCRAVDAYGKARGWQNYGYMQWRRGILQDSDCVDERAAELVGRAAEGIPPTADPQADPCPALPATAGPTRGLADRHTPALRTVGFNPPAEATAAQHAAPASAAPTTSHPLFRLGPAPGEPGRQEAGLRPSPSLIPTIMPHPAHLPAGGLAALQGAPPEGLSDTACTGGGRKRAKWDRPGQQGLQSRSEQHPAGPAAGPAAAEISLLDEGGWEWLDSQAELGVAASCSNNESGSDIPDLVDCASDEEGEESWRPGWQFRDRTPLEPHPDLESWADSAIVMAALHEELEPMDPPAVALDPEERLNSFKFGAQLTPTQVEEMKAVLRRHLDAFSWSKYDLGRTHLAEMEIDTGDSPPVASRPYRMSRQEQELERLEVQRMLRAGIIEPSNSPWASPLCMVPKKSADGQITGIRLTVDLRRVNQLVRRPQMPMPRIDDMLDRLSGSCFWSKCDLNSSFWQLPLAPKDREKTAFRTSDGQGLYQFTVMPQGLTSSPAYFQQLMNIVLEGHSNSMAYMDDAIAYSRDWASHLRDVDEMLRRIREAGMKIAPNKCEFGCAQMVFLGTLIDKDGNRPDPAKIEAVARAPRPVDKHTVRAFYGLASYYRRWVANFASIARPLSELLKKEAPFEWGPPQEQAFQTLKAALCSSPILTRPDFSRPFELKTDWCPHAVAAILSQRDEENRERVVAYSSRLLKGAETRYPPVEGEILALVYGVTTFRPYLWHHPFQVYTDHAALRWALTTTNIQGRVAKWGLLLQGYMIQAINYKPGTHHGDVDGLSRLLPAGFSDPPPLPTLEELDLEGRAEAGRPGTSEPRTGGSLQEEEKGANLLQHSPQFGGEIMILMASGSEPPHHGPVERGCASPTPPPATEAAAAPTESSPAEDTPGLCPTSATVELGSTAIPWPDSPAVVLHSFQFSGWLCRGNPAQPPAAGDVVVCHNLQENGKIGRVAVGPLTVTNVEEGGAWCMLTDGRGSYRVACARLRPLPQPFLPGSRPGPPSSRPPGRGSATQEEPIPADLTCEVCGSDKDDAAMLVCDGCSRGYHLWCLQPPLLAVPPGSWNGPCCSSDATPTACMMLDAAAASGEDEEPGSSRPRRAARPRSHDPAAAGPLRAALQTAPAPSLPRQPLRLLIGSGNSPSELSDEQVVPEMGEEAATQPQQTAGTGEGRTALQRLDSAGSGERPRGTPASGDLQPGRQAEPDEEAGDRDEDEDAPLDITLDQAVLSYLESGAMPADLPTGEKKRIRSRASGFLIQEGQLYKKPDKRYGPRKVPAIEERPGLIRRAHDELGHAGEQRTRHLLRAFWWRGMVQQVKEHVRSCVPCQEANPRFERQDTLNPIKVPLEGPTFSRVGVDLLGPFPTSSDGSTYAITCVEYSTRFAAAGALPDKRSETVANWMAQYIGTHSVPKVIMSDRGTEFSGEAFQALCERCLIDHRFSSAYTPNVNGLVEKFNDVVGRALRRTCGRDPTRWHEELPFIVLGYNSTIQTSTRHSPFRLLYGREPSLPLHNVLPDPQPAGSADLTLSDGEVERRESEQRTLNLRARENIEAAQTRQQEDYLRRRAHAPRTLKLQPNEYVMERLEGTNGKLSRQAAGPFRFLKYTDPEQAVCLLEDSEGRLWRTSAKRVRRWVQRRPPRGAAAPPGAAAAAEAAAAAPEPESTRDSPRQEEIIIMSSSEGASEEPAKKEQQPSAANGGAPRQKRRRQPTAKVQQLQEEERLKQAILGAIQSGQEEPTGPPARPNKRRNKGAAPGRQHPLALDLRPPRACRAR